MLKILLIATIIPFLVLSISQQDQAVTISYPVRLAYVDKMSKWWPP